MAAFFGGLINAASGPTFGPCQPPPNPRPNPPHPFPATAPRPLKKGDHVFLVDGSGYIFRAYHAISFEPRTPDGTHVNAVYGFCTMLWKLLRR